MLKPEVSKKILCDINLFCETEKYDEFLNYLKQLDFSKLNEDLLYFIKERIENIIMILSKKRIIDDYWFIFTLILFILHRNLLYFGFFLAFGYSGIEGCLKAHKKYCQLKALANPLLCDIQHELDRKKGLNCDTIKQQDDYTKSQSEEVSYNHLMEKVSELESKIILLPSEQKIFFCQEIQKALTEYQKGLESFDEVKKLTPSNTPSFPSTFNEKLNELDELISKALCNEEGFNNEIQRKTDEYLENVEGFEDKQLALKELEQYFISQINLEDQDGSLNISKNFSKCFWKTIKLCDEYNQGLIIDAISPLFLDRIIIDGEENLNCADQTIEVIAIRKELYQIRNSSNYDAKEYLRFLLQALNKFNIKPKFINRSRSLYQEI